MKTGILTFHRCINYGSYWQARCLAEGLKTIGITAEILDHRSPRVDFAEWKCALQPVLPTPVPRSDIPLYRRKIETFFNHFDQLPLSPSFSLTDPSAIKGYDTVIVGSDEVWNLFHPWYGSYSVFYGEGIKTGRLISYAASFGNYDSTWSLDQGRAQMLRRFERLSVRDDNSVSIIKNSLGLEPALVLDPCLQFPGVIRNSFTPDRNGYGAVYGHNFSSHLTEQALRWARKNNMPLVSIGYRNDWADEQWLTAGPEDFNSFIRHSDAVVTNFFHGCVFALLYMKPFVCEISPYRGNKVRGLLKKIGGENHLISETMTSDYFQALLREPPGREIVETIESQRKKSAAWLNEALKKNEKSFQSA